jgi:signal transduction histidine kinase
MYHPRPLFDEHRSGFIDTRLLAATRLILSLSFLLIGDEPWRFHYSNVTLLVLIFYIIHSFNLYYLSVRRGHSPPQVLTWAPWADIAYFTVLIWLSSGTNGFLFFGYLFAIIATSFGGGFRSGLLATVTSSVIIMMIALALHLLGQPIEIRVFLIRALYILVLGYLVAHWSDIKITLDHRLRLLQKISSPALLRTGLDNLVGASLILLRELYDADAALLLIARHGSTEYRLYRAERNDPVAPPTAEIIPEELLRQMLTPPPTQSGIYGKTPSKWWRLHSSYQAYDVVNREPTGAAWDESRILATMLDAKTFITVPLRSFDKTVGRLYLTAQRQHTFNESAMGFLFQFTEHLMPIIDNIWVTDRLAFEAAEEERQRIARDIHDSIIQPYIGLQMGLVGLHRRLATECSDTSAGDDRLLEVINNAASDTERLIEMTDGGIGDLRSYVRELREDGRGERSLLSAVRRFAAKFTQATNIIVQVKADDNIKLADELTSEIFQMIVEGLSNIRKHTQSMRAYIGLGCSGGRLVLRIENDDPKAKSPARFTPRSIMERAEALGGRAYVEAYDSIGIAVVAEIPL